MGSNIRAPKEDSGDQKDNKMKKKDDKKPFDPNATRKTNIIRVMSTDLDADKQVAMALTDVKGVGYNFSRAVLHAAKIPPTTILGTLKEADLVKIEEIVNEPLKYKIPEWMINRQRDYETNESSHLTGSDLTIKVRDDINRLKKIRAYRGVRHEMGKPVRGQRTKSSFRRGGSLGVQKKKDAPAAAKPADSKK